MRFPTLFRLGFGLLLLAGSVSVISCKTEDVRPRNGRNCHATPTPTDSTTTNGGTT